MKKILFAIAILIFAAGCSDPNTGTTSTPPSTSKYKKYAGDDEIKIMSFNVRTSGMDKNTVNHWENRKEACIALIKDHKPTIIGFQETTYTDQWVYLKNQLKSSGYEGYGLNRQNGEEGGYGEVSAILYDKNLVRMIDAGTIWLSETPDTPSKGFGAGYYRTASWGLFEHIHTGQEFLFINTHLDHESELAQVEGMKLIAKKFEEYKKSHSLFLTGDLNVEASHKAIEAIKSFMRNARTYAYPTDSYGTTNGFKTKDSNKKIDHIYYSDHLKPVEYYTIREEYNGVEFVSDHFPIYAIIKVKK